MRPLKKNYIFSRTSKKKRRNSTKKISTAIEGKKLLIDLWQILFFLSISILLIFTYLDQAWRTINIEQIQITGLSGIKNKDVKKVTSIFFPKNLLEINPKEIEAFLIKSLPIKSISVNRQFFPPGIHLNFREREPIAFASRISSKNIENGMIDIEGYWIPIEFVNQSKINSINLFVENWTPSKKDDITLIIKNRSMFQSPLQKIKLSPLHEISIETEHFNSVLLGSNTNRLIDQINKLNQLQKSLPNLLINTKVKTVDLKDPSKPELKTEKILSDEV